MQKNLYFRNVLRRHNVLGEAISNFFLGLASYPRLLLEVFIRKNFGDRYFSIASVITVAVVLLFLPMVTDQYINGVRAHLITLSNSMSEHKTWYLFILLFLVFSAIRYFEIKKNPSVFDFGRFSLSSGDINPLFFKIRFSGKKPSVRMIETVYEPALFFILGLLLRLMDDSLGPLLVWCSIFYSLGYVGAYKRGDDFVKDKIDEMICNEEMENAFVKDEENNKRGVRIRTEKPTSEEMRTDLVESFVVYQDEAAVVS